jgi:hypothetical protein
MATAAPVLGGNPARGIEWRIACMRHEMQEAEMIARPVACGGTRPKRTNYFFNSKHF